MKDLGLVSIRQEAKKLYTDDIKRHKNYLNQEFDPDAPNQVCVSDIAYFKCNGKSYYICVIIDLYARKVISYKVGKKNSTQLINTSFKQAYENRQPSSSLIFHTDRGANYCSKTLMIIQKRWVLLAHSPVHMCHTTIPLSNLSSLP